MKKISIENQDINVLYNASLNASATAASSTASVYSISNLAINQVALIGEFGQEGSEIILLHAATSPTGNTITFASNLVKSHPKDTPVYIIAYDQVCFYHAATATGDKTLLGTISLDAESDETIYNDIAYDSGYYFTRFKNSITTTYSSYSDPIPYDGWESNTVGYAINLALGELGKNTTETLTYNMLIAEINACLRYVRGKLKRWSNVFISNYELDATLAEDDYTWNLPEDYYDKNSNRSCHAIWIEDEIRLEYKDKMEFDDLNRDAESGTPLYFTIYDGNILITPAAGSEFVGLSIYMDYWTDIIEVDSDADELTLARFDMVKHWLMWMIKNITENNGKKNFEDGDWVMFNSILSDAVRRESSGQKFKPVRKLNGISYNTIQ